MVGEGGTQSSASAHGARLGLRIQDRWLITLPNTADAEDRVPPRHAFILSFTLAPRESLLFQKRLLGLPPAKMLLIDSTPGTLRPSDIAFHVLR